MMDELFEGALFTEDADEQPINQLRETLAYCQALGRMYVLTKCDIVYLISEV
jgi:hypothetical protein